VRAPGLNITRNTAETTSNRAPVTRGQRRAVQASRKNGPTIPTVARTPSNVYPTLSLPASPITVATANTAQKHPNTSRTVDAVRRAPQYSISELNIEASHSTTRIRSTHSEDGWSRSPQTSRAAYTSRAMNPPTRYA